MFKVIKKVIVRMEKTYTTSNILSQMHFSSSIINECRIIPENDTLSFSVSHIFLSMNLQNIDFISFSEVLNLSVSLQNLYENLRCDGPAFPSKNVTLFYFSIS